MDIDRPITETMSGSVGNRGLNGVEDYEIISPAEQLAQSQRTQRVFFYLNF